MCVELKDKWVCLKERFQRKDMWVGLKDELKVIWKKGLRTRKVVIFVEKWGED